MKARRLFLVLFPLTLGFRLWLGWAMPITGDEAYFVDWGRHPDWGFYDHPPMVGWWLAAQLLAGDAQVWLRLSAILQPALLALACAWMLPRLAPGVTAERAWWAALLVLLAPVNVWNVFVTTDTPLIYFSLLAALAWLRATQDDHRGWYVVAGIMLVGAVLSKYFAALLGFALLVHALTLRRKGAFAGLAIAYACTLPALALMAWWNAGHCWVNVMFNFVNRNEGAGLNAMTPLLYAATLLYVVSPPALWLWWKSRDLRGEDGGLWLLAAVPFALFALLSLAKTVGLHWLLGFVPLVLLWLALRLPQATLNKLGNFFIGFAALHVAIIAAVALAPMESWKRTQLYDGIVLTFEAERLVERLQPFAADYAFASDGYSNAATLSYRSPQRFMVFGEGGYHARQDDFVTDWREHDGRNILILTKRRPASADFSKYFHEVEFKAIELRGVTFTAVLGRGFNYAAYREDVLARVKSRYYALPAWLPQRGCQFCDRHFPDTACTR
ncbi:MAG: glycosyltransferase family 39 protein [Gammaproteobacteria bacterium]|nr:glycosyltransferase family 39 protein [Gammaproteobacteria bacterium]MBU1645998.1 glycosyltransferase family 39 protein [Gammaproteobacteria bacterium]MBU1972060.1 glycosyltransferase family 39 protein [Gammaproteobacteria bacterium]